MDRKKKEKVGEALVQASVAGIGLMQFPGASIAAALIGANFPNRRLERIEKMLTLLGTQTMHLNPQTMKGYMEDPAFSDFFERSVYDAAEAVTEERLTGIANILRMGLREKLSLTISKKCMKTLEDLGDLEITIFYYISGTDAEKDIFENNMFDSIKAFLMRMNVSIGKSDIQDFDDVLQDSITRLFRQDLLVRNELTDENLAAGLPEFSISRYGLVFARYIHGEHSEG